jgi:glycosyltransferase involved in cell wall biosynthesis
MRHQQLVSVIIPTYNREKYISQAVKSALEQTYRPLEIIVVDDGSIDDTKKVLSPYLDSIKYIYQSNSGAAIARNAGIAASGGVYVAMLDSDDMWKPEKLSHQIEFLETHPNVALVATHAICIDSDGNVVSNVPVKSYQKEGSVSFETILLNSPMILSSLVVRRECLPQPQAFPVGVAFCEDWEFCLQISRRFGAWFLSQPLTLVRRHSDNITHPLANQINVDDKLRNRLGVIQTAKGLFSDMDVTINSLFGKAEAIEYSITAIQSYANGEVSVGKERLAAAIEWDPANWQATDRLVNLMIGYSDMIADNLGIAAAATFINDIIENLPLSLSEDKRFKKKLVAQFRIFVSGYRHLDNRDLLNGMAHISSGFLHQPKYLANRGIIKKVFHAVLNPEPI